MKDEGAMAYSILGAAASQMHESSRINTGSKWSRRITYIRLFFFPMALAVVLASPDRLMKVIERTFGVQGMGVVTRYVVYEVSTWRERAIAFVLFSLLIGLLWSLCRRFRSASLGYLLFMLFVGVVQFGVQKRFGAFHGLIYTGLLTIIIAVNTIPFVWINTLLDGCRTASNVFFGASICVAEVFALRPYVCWVSKRLGRNVATDARIVLAGTYFILIPAVFSLLFPFSAAVQLDRKLFHDPDVQLFVRGDFGTLSNGDFGWIAFDSTHQRLFACGNGQPRLESFDPAQPSHSPLLSQVDTDNAQACGFDAMHDELYAYNRRLQKFVWFDPMTLLTEREIPLHLANEGETWIESYGPTDTIVVADENDPIAFVDRQTGQVQSWTTLGGAYATTIPNPAKPYLYVNCYRRCDDIIKYDFAEHRIVATTKTDSRTDKTIFDATRNQLLVPSPMHSRILLYDADSLATRGVIETVFGVRTMAIDTRRDLLVVGSFLTNEVEVIDLRSHRAMMRYRTGPWMRWITLDEHSGVAYVSSLGGIYKVNYLSRVSPAVRNRSS